MSVKFDPGSTHSLRGSQIDQIGFKTRDMSELPQLPNVESPSRLLVVDDEAALRQALAELLQQRGYDVEEAMSGQDALARLQAKRFDLMILDMVMPGMSGVEVMRQARQKYPELLIVVLTSHATADGAIAAVKANVSDYLLKPCSIDDLAVTLARILQERTRQARRQHLLSMVNEAMEMLRQTEEPAESHSVAQSVLTGPASNGHVMRVGPLMLDREKRLATIDGDADRVVELTEGEVSILALLMAHPNQVLSCNQLADSALGYQGMDRWTVESVVRSSVFRLRQKIEPAPDSPRLICTVRGRGYFFSPA